MAGKKAKNLFGHCELLLLDWEVMKMSQVEAEIGVAKFGMLGLGVMGQNLRVAIEAGSSLGWRRYVGIDGAIIARRHFGASAPLKDLLKQFGFTTENLMATARTILAGERCCPPGKD
ncbi:hypothetical protein MYX84_06635 [Acidobacteria bacterium AH-259-O06]|nr:hypothetical protein [Acidobacteria bacterium AH-259-O06]